MAPSKSLETWQYGDFQTPYALAQTVCRKLRAMGIIPRSIIEPNCGVGAFLRASAETFGGDVSVLGADINADYIEQARASLPINAVRLETADFFQTDWQALLASLAAPVLVLGNPPWVTNAELGVLKSANLPKKSNFKGHKGLDALTGKANFDISESMLLQEIQWLKQTSGWIAMLLKTAVARKILRYCWRNDVPVGPAQLFKIDAHEHFGASVEACLFLLPVNMGDPAKDCAVYPSLSDNQPARLIGYHDGILVADVSTFKRSRAFLGHDSHYVWRSGVKHDCSKVMELKRGEDGGLTNGFGKEVHLEERYVYPMLKSSEVAKGKVSGNRVMIVPQKEIGEDTRAIRELAPNTWDYLLSNADYLDGRGSVIYKGKPRFSIFGVGSYSFAPWKIAISGFYKNLLFSKIGQHEGRPFMLDDTIYFLPCWSEDEADFLMKVISSEMYQDLFRSMVFLDEKRPVTADILKRISIAKIAERLALTGEYKKFVSLKSVDSTQIAMAL